MCCSIVEGAGRADVPDTIISVIRVGRMTALRKPDGGVPDIVAGDVIRRLVARTISQQLSKTVEAATAPFQYALSTRTGCECIAHTLQGLTELNPRATVVSIDGISACDQISRAAILSGLLNVEGGNQALPFVRMFYGSPSSYSWEDSCGVSHTIRQGEGGEQGDALMPLLFALGQHRALVAIQSELQDGEFLFAYLDDIFAVVPPDRVGAVYASMQQHLWAHCRIRVHTGKTQVWNREAQASSHFGSRIWSCGDQTLVCVCKTRTSSEIFLPLFVFSLRFQVMSQPRRSARLAARFARASPPSQPPQPMAIDLTDTEPISDGLSDDPVFSEVDVFPAPSCFVCDGHFTPSGPLSRCVLQCCPLSIHLQCVTDLVHLPSQSVVCPACNSHSPSSLDFLHFQHLCCVRHVEAPAGECMVCSSSDLRFFLLSSLLPSTHSL